jgi:DNA-binding NarL/FixJ family response regulator
VDFCSEADPRPFSSQEHLRITARQFDPTNLVKSPMPKSVLIADDHEAIRRELRRLFQCQPEFTVCGEAVDGVDAISKAQQLSPDLVILDFAMPEMNGLEAAIAIQYMVPSATLFLLTAYHTRELELAALQFGARAVFSKYDN